MGTDERPAGDSLIARLLGRPQGFNLFQAVSLLERARPDAPRVGHGNRTPEAVRLSAVPSLRFEPSDVAQVSDRSDTGEPYTLRTPVLSLAGAQGPLPLVFTEMLLDRRAARDHAMADFLDIFNHRFLAFLYRGRKKHNVGLNWDSHETSSLALCLDRLSALGLSIGERGPRGESEWLRHAGLMGGAPRSMAGLVALLSDRFAIPVQGRQFQGGWQRVEASEHSRLGARGAGAPRLGRNAVLGRRAWYQGNGVQIELGPLSSARLDRFLPTGSDHQLANWLVRRYMQQDVQVEVCLRPAPGEAGRLKIGKTDGPRLGWTSWLAARPSTSLPATRLRLGTPAAAVEEI